MLDQQQQQDSDESRPIEPIAQPDTLHAAVSTDNAVIIDGLVDAAAIQLDPSSDLENDSETVAIQDRRDR